MRSPMSIGVIAVAGNCLRIGGKEDVYAVNVAVEDVLVPGDVGGGTSGAAPRVGRHPGHHRYKGRIPL